MITSHSLALAKALDLGVHNSHVPSKRIVSREGFLLATHRASDLLLTAIVYRILVSCEIVRPREDRVAWLVGRRVDARTLVWSGLRVAG